MNYFEHTANYYKGESFIGWVAIILGVSLLLLTFFFWKNNHYAAAKALVIPILIVGLFWSIAGGISIVRNPIKSKKALIEYNNNSEEFILSSYR